jgi:type IV secretion system protein VirB3
MQTDQIFKGATRPPMKLGIPLFPMMATLIPGAICATWGFFIFGPWVGTIIIIVLIMVLVYMREVTKKDDQRLLQAMKRMTNVAFINNKHWDGKMSATPQKRRMEN